MAPRIGEFVGMAHSHVGNLLNCTCMYLDYLGIYQSTCLQINLTLLHVQFEESYRCSRLLNEVLVVIIIRLGHPVHLFYVVLFLLVHFCPN
jgi:hypothetical protein